MWLCLQDALKDVLEKSELQRCANQTSDWMLPWLIVPRFLSLSDSHCLPLSIHVSALMHLITMISACCTIILTIVHAHINFIHGWKTSYQNAVTSNTDSRVIWNFNLYITWCIIHWRMEDNRIWAKNIHSFHHVSLCNLSHPMYNP